MGFVESSYYLLVVYCTTVVLSDSVIKPCKIEDESCIDTSVQAAIPKILAGFPELGVKSSDPLYIERIDANLTGFTYIFFNSTTTGIKDCVVSNLKVDSKLSKLHYELNCPSVKVEGEYQMAGILISIPVEGNGHFTIITGNYIINVDSKLQTTVSDGKTYLNIQDVNLKLEGLTPVKYAFENMYNGHKEKGDAFHMSAHGDWKKLQKQASRPTWQAIFDNVKNNVNTYLKFNPLEDLKL